MHRIGKLIEVAPIVIEERQCRPPPDWGRKFQTGFKLSQTLIQSSVENMRANKDLCGLITEN
jgi:hypothetical protein